jgi:hypothetical protein
MAAKTYTIEYQGKEYIFDSEDKASSFLDHLSEVNKQNPLDIIEQKNKEITDKAIAAQALGEMKKQNAAITKSANLAKNKSSHEIGQIIGSIAGPPGRVLAEQITGGMAGDSNSSALGTFANQLANSALINKLPEASSALAEKLGGLPYQQGVQSVRQDLNTEGENYPISSLLGQVMGSYVNPISQVSKYLPVVNSIGGRLGINALQNVAAGQAELPLDASAEQRLKQGGIDTLISGGMDSLLGILSKHAQAKQISQSLKNADYQPSLKENMLVEPSLAKRELENAGFNVPMLPADAKMPSGADTVQSFLSKSPFSQGYMKQQGLKQHAALSDIAQAIESGVGLEKRIAPSAIGPVEVLSKPINFEDASIKIGDKIASRKQAISKLVSDDAQVLQNKILLPISSQTVSPDNTLSAIAMAKKESSGGAGDQIRDKAFLKLLTPESISASSAEKVLTANKTKNYSFNEITGERTKPASGGTTLWNLYKYNKDINETLRNNTNLTPTERSFLSSIKDGINTDLSTLSSQGGKVGKAAQAILDHNENATKLFTSLDSQILNKINTAMAKNDSGSVNKLIYQMLNKNDLNGLKEIERVAGPELTTPIKQDFVQKLLRGDTKNQFEFDVFGGGKANPNSNPLRKRLAGVSDSTLEYVLGSKDSVKTLKNLAAVAPYLEGASKAKRGDTFDVVDVATLGATSAPLLKGMAQGDSGAIAKGLGFLTGVIGVNKALARFYTHPEVINLLTYKTGKVLGPSQAKFVAKRLMSKLVELSAREEGVQVPEENKLSE